MLQEIVDRVFPRQRLIDAQPLESLRNANFMLKLGSAPELAVLRIYEHDPSLCRKELDLLAMIRNSVPVPEVLDAEPDGLNEIPPFVVCRYVEGIEFRELKCNREACPQAAYEVGRTLAHIARTTFTHSGWLGPGPSVLHAFWKGQIRSQGLPSCASRHRTFTITWDRPCGKRPLLWFGHTLQN